MSRKNTNEITNPHDQFFRTAMADKRVSHEFLKQHLPEELCTLVDFNKLELQPRSQVNAVRQESTVDLLFKTAISGKDAYLYLLLEHQSSPDPLMSFRVLQYTVNAISEHLKQNKTTKIPLIYPLVIYHGRSYQFIRDINELVDAPKDLVERYFLKPFQLVDLSKIDDEVIKKNMWSGIMLFALKHIFERDMLPYLRDFMPMLAFIDQQNGSDLVGLMLQYTMERGELSDENALFDLINTHISHETGEKIMTLAEKFIMKGKLEGKLEGQLDEKMHIAKKMLSEGVDPVFIARITGLSLDQIKCL